MVPGLLLRLHLTQWRHISRGKRTQLCIAGNRTLQVITRSHGRSSFGWRCFISSSNSAKIVVGRGDTARELVMSVEVLASRSKALPRSFKKRKKQGLKLTRHLPKQDPTAFAVYEEMVRTGKAPSINNGADALFCSEAEPACDYARHYCQPVFERLCHTYILATELEDIVVKNAVVDALISKITHGTEQVEDKEIRCLPGSNAVDILFTPHYAYATVRPAQQVIIEAYVLGSSLHASF
jgi:hypothetical protein